MNIVLIGYRGSGKSTLGRRLADQLALTFVDTDVLLAQRAGRTIAQIFATEGESAFRDRESAILAEVCSKDRQVIAVGGGAILRPQNIAAMKRATASGGGAGDTGGSRGGGGKIIYLQARPETLFARITADSASPANRPNLTLAGGLEEVQKLLALRTPLYQSAADSALDVTSLTPEDALLHLTRLL